MATVEMTANEDAQARTGAAARLLGELEAEAIELDGVVARHDALVLMAEDLREVDAPQGNEGRGGVAGGPAELDIEGGQEALAEVAVGGAGGGDPLGAQLIDEALDGD
jgi:hypothetical protein